MQTTTIKPFGVSASLSVPSTPEEYDSLAKATRRCLADAIKYHLYHVHFSELRDVILHGRDEEKNEAGEVIVSAIKGLDDSYGVERKTKPVLGKDNQPVLKDGKPVTQWDEKEEAFFTRLLAEKGLKADSAKIVQFVQSVVDQIPFDPSVAERAPRVPKKLAQAWKDAATKLIAGGQIDKLNDRLKKAIDKTFTPTEVAADADDKVKADAKAKDVEALGWLVKEFSDWNAQQSLIKLGVNL